MVVIGSLVREDCSIESKARMGTVVKVTDLVLHQNSQWKHEVDRWMSYNSNNRVRYLCRYLCYKKERERDDTIWDNLINKEDYEFITPIRNTKKKEFVFLNDNELNKLTESQYIQYNTNLEEYYWKNPERARIREQEIINENYLMSL